MWPLIFLLTTLAWAQPQGTLFPDDSQDPKQAGGGYDYKNEAKPFPIVRGYIERVEFQNAADGVLLGLSVSAHHGEQTLTVAEVKDCIK
ncbi:MAG: hypothetical protein ABI833_05580 [Acidobacteriota bacterium]